MYRALCKILLHFSNKYTIYINNIVNTIKVEGKAVPLQAWSGSDGSQIS